MWYELWGMASGNLISDFDSEAESVEAALAYLTPSGSGPAVDVSLIVCDDSGRSACSLEGEALVTWVELRADDSCIT